MVGRSMNIELLAELIKQAQKIVVFTGAGVSTESGIPDFRGPAGIWKERDPDDFTIEKFLSSAESRKEQWRLFMELGFAMDAKPNAAHYAITELDKMGKLDCVITQNVDNLHQKAGVPCDKVFELHGNMQWVICLTCGRRYPFEQIKVRLDQGEGDPRCEVCQGILKPDAIFFGEQLPQETLRKATWHSQNCDIFIIVGSTLVVYPAAYMPMYAKTAGAQIAIVNLTATSLDRHAILTIRGKAGEVMSEVIKEVKGSISS